MPPLLLLACRVPDIVAEEAEYPAQTRTDSAPPIDTEDTDLDSGEADGETGGIDTAVSDGVTCEWASAVTKHEYGSHDAPCASVREAWVYGTWMLVSPWGVSDATEARSVLATARDWADLPVTSSTHWYRDALAYGCPTGSTDEAGLTTYVGGCTTPDGRTYAGTVTEQEVDSGLGRCQDFDHFEIDESDGSVTMIDGRYEAWMIGDMGGHAQDIWICTNGSGSASDAEREVRGFVAVSNMTLYTSFYTSLMQSSSGAGDYTVDVEVRGGRSSTDFWYSGTERVIGTSSVTLTWNSEEACAGCADVEVDGVAAEAYCP